MTTMPRSEWKPRAAFAEIAEALDVRTDQILACMWRGRDATVLWTDDDETADPPVYMMIMRRSSDGIIRPASTPRISGRVSDITGLLPPEASA